MAESPLIAFRAVEPVGNELRKRTSIPLVKGQEKEKTEQAWLAQTAYRDLDRLYVILRQILPRFSMNEAMLLVEVSNGTRFEPYVPQSVLFDVEESLSQGYAEKWQVDGPALVGKLAKLGKAELYAIADAIEQAWTEDTYQVDGMEKKLIQVGLVAPEEPGKKKPREAVLHEMATSHGYASVDDFVEALSAGKLLIQSAASQNGAEQG